MTSIRTAILEDSEAIAQVHVNAWRESYRAIVPEAMLSGLSVSGRAEMWRQIITELPRDNPVFVAEQEGHIVGFANGGPCRGTELGQEMEIYCVYLLERAKRQGTGGTLLKAVMKGFLSQGASSAGLWVLRDNWPARKFYERFGAHVATEKVDSSPEGDLIEVGYIWPDIGSAFSI